MNNILIIGSETFDRYADIEDYFSRNYISLFSNKPNIYIMSSKGIANCVYHYARYHHIPNFKSIEYNQALKKNILKQVDSILAFNNVDIYSKLLIDAERKKINIQNINI